MKIDKKTTNNISKRSNIIKLQITIKCYLNCVELILVRGLIFYSEVLKFSLKASNFPAQIQSVQLNFSGCLQQIIATALSNPILATNASLENLSFFKHGTLSIILLLHN